MRVDFLKGIFEKTIKSFGDKSFLCTPSKDFTFCEVLEESLRFKGFLKQKGIGRGDRLVLRQWNTVDFVVSYFGCILADAVPVSTSPLLSEEELGNIVLHSGSKLVIHSLDKFSHESFFKDERYKISEDCVAIIYTSGTTSAPKGVLLTINNIAAQIHSASKAINLRSEDSTVSLLSFSHVFGQMDILWACLSKGVSVHLLEKFDAKTALEIITRNKLSFIIAVPAMYRQMLKVIKNRNLEISSLRVCHSGAAPMPLELGINIETFFKAPLQEGYGLTETTSMAFSNPLGEGRKIGSVGLPIEGVSYKLLQDNGEVINKSGVVGEVCINGNIISPGYFKLPASHFTNINGAPYLPSGDLGYFDEDGYLYLVDRKKDMIIKGGLKIYPRDIEEVLLQHQEVDECSVVGIPLDNLEERVHAFIKPKNEIASGLEHDLREYCLRKLAAYKVPNTFHFIEEIPKTFSGKTLKRNLRNLITK